MNLFETVDKDSVHYVHIERSQEVGNKEFLEYMVWLKPDGLNLTGYRIREELRDAYINLGQLAKLNTPSNFSLLRLYDSDVLSVIRCRQSACSSVLEPSAVVKIELQFPEYNIYSILYKLIDAGAMIEVEGAPGFSPVKNLTFNKDNLDIVWRYYDDEVGFKSYHVYRSGVVANMTIRTPVEVNIPHMLEHKITGGMYEYILNPNKVDTWLPKLLINGEEANHTLSIALLGLETLTLHYCMYFDSDITYKTCDALYQYMTKTSAKKFSRSDRYYSSTPEKVCSIMTTRESVQASNLKRTFEAINFNPAKPESMEELTALLVKIYGVDVTSQILTFLLSFEGRSEQDIIASCQISLFGLSVNRARLGVRASALKDVFSKNRIFKQMCVNQLLRYESCVFEGYSIYAQAYESQAELQRRAVLGTLKS